MRKILLIGIIFICISLMLSACAPVSTNKDDSQISSSDKSNAGETQSESLDSINIEESNYKSEDLLGKVILEKLVIDKGQISFQIRNLTKDNILLSAYFEYTRLEDGKQYSSYPLDCDKLKISAGDVSSTISFNPQKPLGKHGIVKIKQLIFEDNKDNYRVGGK
ncbi:hypothetical protein [Hathewaya proteolytica]|nr:hypothetical protein [Hathewaya proteolytica]